MKLFFVSDTGARPLRIMDDAAASRLAKNGRTGVLLRVEGDIYTGSITKAADVGAPRLTEARAIETLRRTFAVRMHRPQRGNFISSIVAGAA